MSGTPDMTPGVDWRTTARCRNLPPSDRDLAFGGPIEQRRFAVQFCGRCPVRPDCLLEAQQTEAALPASRRHGIYGGWNGGQRERLARGEVKPCRRCRTALISTATSRDTCRVCPRIATGTEKAA